MYVYMYIRVLYRCVEVDRCRANWRTGRRVLYLVSRSSPPKEIGKLFTRGHIYLIQVHMHVCTVCTCTTIL